MNPSPDPIRALCRLAATTVAAFATLAGAETARAQQNGSPAQEPSVVLTWTAPEQCPDERWVRAEIERLIGRPIVTEHGETTITARGSLQGTKKGDWILRLSTAQAGSRGFRELKAEQCNTLAEAAALILALSIDSRAVAERRAEKTGGDDRQAATGTPVADAIEADGSKGQIRPSEPEGEEAAEPEERRQTRPSEPEGEVTELVEPRQTRPSEPEGEATELEEQDDLEPESTTEKSSGTPLHLALRIEAQGDAGTLPGVGAGMGAAVALLLERLRLEGSFGYWPEREGLIEEVRIDGIRSFGAELGLLAGAVGACYRAWPELLFLSACAQLEMGSLYGRGTVNVTRSLPDSALWLALLAGVRASWQVARWGGLVLELDLAAPLLLPGYTLRVHGVTDLVHRPAIVAPRIKLGIELRI